MPQFTNSNLQIVFQAAQRLRLHPQVVSSDPPVLQISLGAKTHRITAKSFGLNSPKAISLSRDKSKTIKILQKHHLPTPQQIIVHSVKEYLSVCQSAHWRIPQVIKPLAGQKGQFVFLNIPTPALGQTAVQQVLNHYPDGCLIESYHLGKDYRFLILNFKVIGLAQRLAPTLTANGRSTIKQLLDQENLRRRQDFLQTGRRRLNRMRNWERIIWHLRLQGLTLSTVLPKAKTITLYPLPNFSSGGSVKTINLQSVPPPLLNLAETAAKLIGLTLCGVDVIIKRSSYLLGVNAPKTSESSLDLSGECRIIELNSDPGLRLHDWPNQGTSQHTAETILKSIF